MSPIAWAIRPLKRYANFNGRSPRPEYWWFVFFQWLMLIALVLLAVAVAGDAKESNPFYGAFIVPLVIGFLSCQRGSARVWPVSAMPAAQCSSIDARENS